jgi:hypothetical protein
MKALLIIMISFFTLKAIAIDCWIVDESHVVGTKGFKPKGKLDKCPKDSSGKYVRVIDDVTYQKNKAQSCSDEADCKSKLVGLCSPTMLDPDPGRPIMSKSFDEVYCTKPVYSAAKRKARKDSEKAKRDAEKSAEDTIKANLKSCHDGLDGSATMPQVQTCLKRVIKQLKRIGLEIK